MIVVGDRAADVEFELDTGRLRCPCCQGRLRRWGFARRRLVRDLPGVSQRWWRPRRAMCLSCSATHVLLPGELLPRRRDTAQAVGAALLAHAAGQGHRPIAARLERPPSTVRNWLRAFRVNARHLSIVGQAFHARLDALAPVSDPTGSLTGDALEALACAARAVTVRFGPGDPWVTINMLSSGRLLTPASTLGLVS